MNVFKAPSELSLDGNLKANWESWKHKFMIFLTASESDKKDEKVKTSMLLNVIGDRANEIYSTLPLTDNTKWNFDAVIAAFDNYFMPRKNITVSRFRFFSCQQAEDQTVDEFITEIQVRSKDCEFADDQNINETLIRDKIICGLKDKKLQEKLLCIEDLKLEKLITLCRTHKEAQVQAKEISKEENVNNVNTRNNNTSNSNRHNTLKTKVQNSNNSNGANSQSQQIRSCKYCGQTHPPRQCPAYRHVCKKCSKYGHFENVCLSSRIPRHQQKKDVQEIQEELSSDSEDESSFYVSTVKNDKCKSNWQFKADVNGTQVLFKLDSGADVNILSTSDFNRLKVKPNLKLNLT